MNAEMGKLLNWWGPGLNYNMLKFEQVFFPVAFSQSKLNEWNMVERSYLKAYQMVYMYISKSQPYHAYSSSIITLNTYICGILSHFTLIQQQSISIDETCKIYIESNTRSYSQGKLSVDKNHRLSKRAKASLVSIFSIRRI